MVIVDSSLLLYFMESLVETVVSLIVEEMAVEFQVKKQMEKLKDNFSTIQDVLQDAAERQHTAIAVRSWLGQLRDVAYDANDLLDEFATEVRRRQLIKLAQLRNANPVSLLNPMRGIFRHEILNRIHEIIERVVSIGERRLAFGLRVSGSRNQDESRELRFPETTSLLSSPGIGRENDKQRVIELLVSADWSGETVSVIPVVGMGGIGKTKLAQIVWNDELVEKHFELRLWAHVSLDFNVNKITKAITESIDSSAFDPISLGALQKHLQEKLSGKKYLLVLDDVWNRSPLEWESLRAPLLSGAKGSQILVTTRNDQVAEVMGTMPPYRLQGLLDNHCWSLFCQHALRPNPLAAFGFQLQRDLDNIREEIINRCNGLPSAAQAIGCRLRRETDRSKWGYILRNESWGDSDISRSIGVSYQHLPANLQTCLAYCSIFPKDFVFEKEVLVQMWMAQSFIRPRGGQRIEDIGEGYFESLLQRSFFQNSHFDYKNNRHKYTMKNVIHNFTQDVSGEEYCIVEMGSPCKNYDKVRHSSLTTGTKQRSSSDRRSIFETIYACKGLYTLLVIGGAIPDGVLQIPDDLAENLRRLRALDLSNSGLSALPKSIGDLVHLRYLQLGNTNIKRLPESVCCLYNLQTLGLGNCYALQELPKDITYLQKLRHLGLHLDDDFVVMTQVDSSRNQRRDSLKSMPPKIGKLTDLQTLSRFVVGTRRRCGLGELQNLNNLHGELRISNLHLVLTASEAMAANLTSKEYLHRLELWWGDGGKNISNSFEEEVLGMLQPHTNLKELKIVGYRGALFPSWIGYSSFSYLVTLVLSDCNKCHILPPLGQLPVLKALYIKGMDGVQFVNCALCGSEARKFPALEKLHFERMRTLQVWCGDERCELHSLRELVIKDCIDLRQLTHKLPSLSKLEIEGSPWFVGLPRFPSLTCLDVKASGEWIWDSLPSLTSLSSLTITQLPTSTLPYDSLPASLTYFSIRHCPMLRALPRGLKDLEALKELVIGDCAQLPSLPDGLKELTSLTRLEISDCPLLSSLPSDGLPTALQFLSINNCPELSQRCRGQDWREIAPICRVWIDKEFVKI